MDIMLLLAYQAVEYLQIDFKSPFLVGILNSVDTEKAWNDDIDCCSISNLSSYIEEYIDLSDFENVRSMEGKKKKGLRVTNSKREYRLLSKNMFKLVFYIVIRLRDNQIRNKIEAFYMQIQI